LATASTTLEGIFGLGSKKNLCTFVDSTYSIFIPPFGEATIAIEPDPLSSKKDKYNYFLKKAFSTKNKSLHFFPCLPV
jgi:hypothetical protein